MDDLPSEYLERGQTSLVVKGPDHRYSLPHVGRLPRIAAVDPDPSSHLGQGYWAPRSLRLDMTTSHQQGYRLSGDDIGHKH